MLLETVAASGTSGCETSELPTSAGKASGYALGSKNTKSWKELLRGKRLFDIVFASILLVILLPALLLIAAAIKISSSGPVIFVQLRNGYAKRPFGMYKFRTMRVIEDGLNAKQCKRNDCRVTPLGRFLRRMSLDELPQLFNVIRGDMSLVGPRPHPLNLDQEFAGIIPYYDDRFQCPPGMTGLAQIRGLRGPTDTVEDMRKRVLADIAYARRRTGYLDFQILALTFPALFSRSAC